MQSQIKSLLFPPYSAKFVREVCGAYKAGSNFKNFILKFDFQKRKKNNSLVKLVSLIA